MGGPAAAHFFDRGPHLQLRSAHRLRAARKPL